MTTLLILVVAAAASLAQFVVHVIAIEWLWLRSWISRQMNDIEMLYSWDVRYIAAVTSIEYGLAAVISYCLAREKLILLGEVKSGIILFIFLACLHGDFLRQPVMNYIIGNPLRVVLVRHSFTWISWLLMSFTVVFGVEYVIQHWGEGKIRPLFLSGINTRDTP
ncbi:MAG: hypothetical protein HRU20_29300 [Pseudomonadales bacterium]|nr:hypothetical protein [Pseudomonadales bacterium]